MVLTLVVSVLPVLSCRQILGVQPRQVSTCSDPLMIDSLEDGDALICDSEGRRGTWYTYGDGSSTNFTPPSQDFTATLIPGRRGTSRYAARFSGSAFTIFGGGMGFVLNGHGLGSGEPYNAASTDGIEFWMKTNVPVSVALPVQATIPTIRGGACTDTSGTYNCDNHFALRITAPNAGEWVEYEIPFSSLGQPFSNDGVFGSATFTPAALINVDFDVDAGTPFDVWIDDVRFYRCAAPVCFPTCTDPAEPVVWCPATSGSSAGCRSGTECPSVVTTGTGGASGTGGAVGAGCTESNTTLAPGDGVIATFAGADSGVEIPGGLYAHTPPTTYSTNGTLHMTMDTSAMLSSLPIDVVVDHFDDCVDATAFTGVQFSISGSLSGCTLGFLAEDSPHLYDFGQPSGTHGSGPPQSHPTFTALTAGQVTSAPQTLIFPFAALANGLPATPVDRAKVTGVGWVFFAGPFTDGGAMSCVADVTVDDVRFY